MATVKERRKQFNKTDWAIKNYLNKHLIHKGNNEMHHVIINSFYVFRGLDIEDSWSAKIIYIQKHFGLFAQYAQNNWKQKQH